MNSGEKPISGISVYVIGVHGGDVDGTPGKNVHGDQVEQENFFSLCFSKPESDSNSLSITIDFFTFLYI